MPYILSPEQKVVVDALICKETSSTKYFDINSALQSICKGCITMVGNGKKILIHIPDEPTKDMLKSIFSKNGLNELTIDITENNSIPEMDVINLRSTLKKEKDTAAIVKYTLSNKKALKQKEDISNFYKYFDKEVMANTPFRDFATKVIYKKKNERPELTISSLSDKFLQFNAGEYYKVKKEILKASETYQRQYDLLDHLSLFKKEMWVDIEDEKIEEIKKLLNEFKEESTKLASDFIKISNSLLEDSSQDLKNAFAVLQEKFLSQEESCIAYHIKTTSDLANNEGIFSLFKKTKTQTSNKVYVDAFDDLSGFIQEISTEWYNELDAPTTEMISYDYIIDFIEKNQEKANFYKNRITKNLEQSVQRINKINTSSTEVTSLDKRLDELIKSMNNSNLFDLELEHNILSFLKQSELSHNIADYIEKCHILFHSSTSYLEWKSFFNSTGDLFRLLFDEIKKLPKKLWIESFENWYEQKIQKNVLGEATISAKELNDYFKQSTLSNQLEVIAVISKLHNQRIEGAKLLKTGTKELYNTLFKKKLMPQVSWKNTALMNRQFMQSFFPIHLSDTFSYTGEYDLVISFTCEEESTAIKAHYFSPIERKDIQNISDKKDNFLYLNEYNYTGLLKNLSSTDKLKAAKKLAKYILSLNQNIKIYQLKNANIISLLPAFDDAKLESELDNHNSKVIDTTGVLYDRLTESILFTERSPILILKDELINCKLNDHLLWQLKIIKTFEDVGYEIMSVNTTDQFNDNQKLFDAIIQKIAGNEITPKESQIQDSDQTIEIPEEVE